MTDDTRVYTMSYLYVRMFAIQCPVFQASPADLMDPIHFIKSIEEEGKKAGIAIIRLPVHAATPAGMHINVPMTL